MTKFENQSLVLLKTDYYSTLRTTKITTVYIVHPKGINLNTNIQTLVRYFLPVEVSKKGDILFVKSTLGQSNDTEEICKYQEEHFQLLLN